MCSVQWCASDPKSHVIMNTKMDDEVRRRSNRSTLGRKSSAIVQVRLITESPLNSGDGTEDSITICKGEKRRTYFLRFPPLVDTPTLACAVGSGSEASAVELEEDGLKLNLKRDDRGAVDGAVGKLMNENRTKYWREYRLWKTSQRKQCFYQGN